MKRSKKLKRKLYSRIKDWETISGDCKNKHPNGFTKPGSNK